MSNQTAVKKYSLVRCVTDGDGYEKGGIYPQVGDNNGVHILRETATGDVYDGVFQTGGIGKGLFNPWDNSGYPSFDPYYEGTKQGDQSAKADGGKLRLTLVPMDAVEAVAAIRMFGVQKYVDEDNWKRVEKDRYKDAALRHFIRYCREPYGMDDESNLPHLWHCLCNLFFLCALEIEDGTLPQPQEAVKRMTRCEPVQARRSPGKGTDGYLFADELKTPGNGVERAET